MSVSESSSSNPYPPYRLKRKPAPRINVAEKYPSPDPQDPFAPLWVLRNRTSSQLGKNPLVNEDTPSPYSQPPSRTQHPQHHGPSMPKFDPFQSISSVPMERRRSNSYAVPHSNSIAPTHIVSKTVHGIHRQSSQAGTTTSRSGHTPLPQSRAPGNITRRLTVDMRTSGNSSGNDTESDLSVPAPTSHQQQKDIKVKSADVESKGKTGNNAGLTTSIKPHFLRRASSNGTTSTGAKSVSAQSQQSRLAKFLLPKKTSHDGYTADGEKRSLKAHSKSNPKGPVHKLSISAPLTNTFVHTRTISQESRQDFSSSFSVQKISRSKGGYTSDTDFEESTGGSGVRLRGVIFRTRNKTSMENTHVGTAGNPTSGKGDPMPVKSSAQPEDERRGAKIEDFQSPIPNPRASYPTPAPSPELKPTLELEKGVPFEEGQVREKAKQDKMDREEGEHNMRSAKRLPEVTTVDFTKVQVPRERKSKATKTTPTAIPHSSSVSTTSSAPMAPPPKMFKRHTSNSTPPHIETTSPVTRSPNDPTALPTTHSISNSSIVHVGLIPPQTGTVDSGTFARPRRAPRPPTTVGLVEGVQSEPEPLTREKDDGLWRVRREEKRQVHKANQDGEEVVGPMKLNIKSDDETQKRQTVDPPVRQTRVPEPDSRFSSRTGVKHSKAASADNGKNRIDENFSKKATLPASLSSPARLPSKGHQGGCLPRLQHTALSRSNDTPKNVSPENSINAALSIEHNPPTRTQLAQAATLPVYAEDGRKLSFGSLFEKQKTVVIFVRHFWCPVCQDYMSVVKSTVTPEMIVADGLASTWREKGNDDDEIVWKNERRRGNPGVEKIGFVIISNSAHGMISKYRQMFSLSFRVYADPSMAVYKMLGMSKTGPVCQPDSQRGPSTPSHYLSDSAAPPSIIIPKKKHSYSLRRKADTSVSSLSEGGGSTKHGLMSGIAMVVVKAMKAGGMPISREKGVDGGQLGGEFVLGPGLICTYAHRMQSPTGHAPIEEVLQSAGVKAVKLPVVVDSPIPPPGPANADGSQKQSQSIDLSSPPKHAPRETRHAQEQSVSSGRNRRVEGVHDSMPASRSSTIVTPAIPVKHRRSQRGERPRNESPIPAPPALGPTLVASRETIIPPALPPAFKAVMTREEVNRWTEERQKSIDRAIQEKGVNVRRVGALGRSPSSQGGPSQAAAAAVLRPTMQSRGPTRQPNVGQGHGGTKTMMMESRSAPIRSFEEEERNGYSSKPEARIRESTTFSRR